MLKAIAGVLVVGSLSAMLACSSSSSPSGSSGASSGSGSSGSGGSGSASGTGDDGGGGSGSSGSTGGDASTGSCPNPLQTYGSATGMTISAACNSCVNSMCSSALSACNTESCQSCAPTLGSCLYSMCQSTCMPASDAGGSGSTGDTGTTPTGDGGADPCAKLTSCNGCALVGASGMSSAGCTSAVSSDNMQTCQGYLSGLQAAGFCK